MPTIVPTIVFEALTRYARSKTSQAKSNSRRFGSGRIIVDHDTRDSNVWACSSALSLSGRAVAADENEGGAPTIKLPRGQDLLLPEAASPDGDLRLSERTRPSPEQSAARKGVPRAESLLQALLKGSSVRGPVMLVQFTGYVEEFGSAAAWLGFAVRWPLVRGLQPLPEKSAGW